MPSPRASVCCAKRRGLSHPDTLERMSALQGMKASQSVVIRFLIEFTAVQVAVVHSPKCTPASLSMFIFTTCYLHGEYRAAICQEIASSISNTMNKWLLAKKSFRTGKPFTIDTSDSVEKIMSEMSASQCLQIRALSSTIFPRFASSWSRGEVCHIQLHWY